MKKIFFLILLASIFSCSNTKITYNKETEVKNLDEFMDAWHHSAAVADEDVFFGSLDSNAVYLGTDASERWTKQEFLDWGLKYFERDTAWAFTPYNRIWAFSEDFKYAWFDELLETHMGVCRGSGVLVRYESGWKIKHYNLAVAVPNERMNDYRKMLNIPVK